MMFFERIGARFTECEKDRFVMVAPVVDEMLQPQGIIHGGMSAYLAETVASAAAGFALDDDRCHVVGLDLDQHASSAGRCGRHGAQRRDARTARRPHPGLEGRAIQGKRRRDVQRLPTHDLHQASAIAF